MRIEVHIKDKMFTINCGDGLQRLRWLGDVAIFRHTHFYTAITSTTKGVRFENGQLLDMNQNISDVLSDGTHVWIILKEDLEALGLDAQKRNKSQQSRILSSTTGTKTRPTTGMIKRK